MMMIFENDDESLAVNRYACTYMIRENRLKGCIVSDVVSSGDGKTYVQCM
jgi:hypothetical protein